MAVGYEVCAIQVDGETRQNITLLDEAHDQYTKFNEPGPAIDARCLAELAACLERLATPGSLWAFCGSLPPGVPDDTYAHCMRLVQGRGGRALLDTSGPALAAGLTVRPYGIKPNSEEAAELLGVSLDDDADHAVAARRLQTCGAEVVALSRGARGMVLAMGDQVLMALPPPVNARSPVGAGDAALAGLLWAILDDCDPAETAARTVACGTAAALQEGTGVGERRLVEELLPQVAITHM